MTIVPPAVYSGRDAKILDDLPDGVVALGDAAGRLLAGEPGREAWTEQQARLGPLTLRRAGADVLEAIRDSGLSGRGGGHFPLWRKIELAQNSPGTPIVVVNGSESEPASAKDRLLMEMRPHLVIDGARAVAAAAGAGEIVIVTHRGALAASSLSAAIRERVTSERGPSVSMASVPNRYIAGESSALLSHLEGGAALPSRPGPPAARSGLFGRPTVVSNVETVCHVALLARFGARWFRGAGTEDAPGSVLLTLCGDVRGPGTVLEVISPVLLADLVDAVGYPGSTWSGGLLGGFAGTWFDRQVAVRTVLQAGRPQGQAGIGCGMVGVLGAHRCGLAEAARLAAWLSDQRAGQCGACSHGLPSLAATVEALAVGRSSPRRTGRKVASLAHSVSGRGRCSLPDSTVAMVESALAAFADEAVRHKKGRCTSRESPGVFPLPADDRRAG